MGDLASLHLQLQAQLTQKYNQSLVFFYTRDINRLVFPLPHDPLVTAFREHNAYLDDRHSYILQFNPTNDLPHRLSFLFSFYRYHLFIPRLLNLKVEPTISLYYTYSRKVQYQKVESLISQLVSPNQPASKPQHPTEKYYESILVDLHSQQERLRIHKSPMHSTFSNGTTRVHEHFHEFIKALQSDRNSDTIKSIYQQLGHPQPRSQQALPKASSSKALLLKDIQPKPPYYSTHKQTISKETTINKALIEHIKRNQKRIQLNIRNNTQKYKSQALNSGMPSSSEECPSPLKKKFKNKSPLSIRMLETLYRPKNRGSQRIRTNLHSQIQQHISDNLPCKNQSNPLFNQSNPLFNSSLPYMRRKGREESKLLDKYQTVMNKIQQRIKGSVSRDKRRHCQPK